MDDAFFRQQLGAARQAYARGLGVPVEAFSTETLTIVDRPDPAAWPYLAMIATFGTGTVMSIEPEYRAFAEANRPEKHFVAAHSGFTRLLVQEAARRDRKVTNTGPALCFVLGAPPPEPEIPAGLELRAVDAAWMRERQPMGEFENGVGKGEQDGRAFRNQYAVALFDERNEPVAVGGVFLTFGLQEIGVDVVRTHRGQGLGRVVVLAATRMALEHGGTPIYGCSVTNIRSNRTALSCGYVPAWSDTSVS